jgi:hypothetical protein
MLESQELQEIEKPPLQCLHPAGLYGLDGYWPPAKPCANPARSFWMTSQLHTNEKPALAASDGKTIAQRELFTN